MDQSRLPSDPDHAHIENEEDERERVFEGLAPGADLSQDHVAADPLDIHEHAPGEGPTSVAEGKKPRVTLEAGDEVPPPPKLHREDPGASPQRIQRGKGPDKDTWESAKAAVSGQGYGPEHGRPRSPEERLRTGVPYSEYAHS